MPDAFAPLRTLSGTRSQRRELQVERQQPLSWDMLSIENSGPSFASFDTCLDANPGREVLALPYFNRRLRFRARPHRSPIPASDPPTTMGLLSSAGSWVMRSSFSASERASTSKPSFFTALLLREKSRVHRDELKQTFDFLPGKGFLEDISLDVVDLLLRKKLFRSSTGSSGAFCVQSDLGCSHYLLLMLVTKFMRPFYAAPSLQVQKPNLPPN